MREFLAVIHPAEEGGYWAEFPALDGCFAQGETVEEVLDDARARQLPHNLAARAEDGVSNDPGGPIILATVSSPRPETRLARLSCGRRSMAALGGHRRCRRPPVLQR